MNKYLVLLGNFDRTVILGLASWGVYDPTHAKLALLCSGFAVGIGYVLNIVSRYYGGNDVIDLSKQIMAKKMELAALQKQVLMRNE